MCKHCFLKEYSSFESEKIWLDFDLQLVKKLGQGNMKFKEVTNEGEHHYSCLHCNQQWKLSDPDHAYRVFF
ncbi:hypothetical protein D7Z94_08765 [Ulvibacterium marinum]|uniref:Uncharacterized protein n=1 Tax=Ulvibacterium marinum TaxID=2419782 RepID=A0A3B0C4X0_9FLAO|nr:hypothetical protein D7Z94_08765 [Ulvibacterium marinum]